MARGSPGGNAIGAFEGFMMLAIGLATIAVLVSKNAQTANVFQATASGIASMLGAATGPVTGGQGAAPQGSAPHY